jgi:hypothetical protein
MIVSLALPFALQACATHHDYSTTTDTTTVTGAPRKKVVKDVIPAEGQRKIPVTEDY